MGMGIRITDLTEITEIQVTTGVRVTRVTATQAGAVDRSTREKMYLTSLFFYKGVYPNTTARGEYQSSGICLLSCLSVLMSI
jgi:hypothetical protein